ncbi:hypothetical protein QQ045_000734 [Rhodiola kirilowii]
MSTNPSARPICHLYPDGDVECMRMNNVLHVLDKIHHSSQACHILDFNQLLIGIVRAKQYGDAIAMYKRFRDEVVLYFSMLNIWMNCYCSVGCTSYGFGILAMVMKRGYLSNIVTYSGLIHWLCRFAEWEKDVFVFAQIKRGVAPNLVTYSALIRGLCQAGKLEEAKEMFIPDVFTYTSFIHGLSVGGKREEAEAMLEEMIRNDIYPNVVTYSSLTYGLCETSNLGKAKGVLCEMGSRGVIPDTITYSRIIIKTCTTLYGEEDEDVCSAPKDTYEWMMAGTGDVSILIEPYQTKPKYPFYGYGMETYPWRTRRKSEWRRGRGLETGSNPSTRALREMWNNGISPDVITFNSIILGLSKAGKKEVAKRILWEMKREGIHSTLFTHSIMICGLLNVRNLKEVAGILNEMMDQGICPNVVIYNTMIHHLFAIGNWEDVVKIYHDMNNNGIFPYVVR